MSQENENGLILDESLFDERSICEAIFKHSAEAIVITDVVGKIVHVNPSLLRLFGYFQYELAMQPIHVLLPPNLRAQHEKHIESYSVQPKARSMGEGKVLFGQKKDGTIFPLSASLSPAQVGKNKLVVGLIIDLTELQDAQNELKEVNNSLENKILERTEALQQSLSELQRAKESLELEREKTLQALAKEKELNELKSKFITTASHEFKTPLSTILSSLNLLEKYENGGDGRKTKHFSRIKNNIQHLDGLLNELLSLEKIQTMGLNPVLEKVDLKRLIERISFELQQSLTDKSGLDLEISVLEASTDASFLEYILVNLIGNAIKYSLNVPEIKVCTFFLNDQWILEISDKGMGIPSAELSNVFERFYRAKNAENIKGTGLGLSIVKQYVDALNGVIEIESEINVGTTVRIKFPY